MPKSIVLLLLFAVLLSSAGCTSMFLHPVEREIVKKDHERAVELFETQYTYENVPPQIIGPICFSYLDLHRYNKFLACEREWHDRFDTIAVDYFNVYGMRLPIIYDAKIRSLIDLGRYDEALKYVYEYIRLIAEEFDFPGDDEHPGLGNIVAFGSAAHIYALKGDRDMAEKNLVRLDDFEEGFMMSSMADRERIVRKVMTRMVLGDYDKALAEIIKAEETGVELNSFDAMAGAMIGIGALQMVFDPVGGILNIAQSADIVFASIESKQMMYEYRRTTIAFWKAKCLYKVGRYDEAKIIYDQILSNPLIKGFAGLYPSLLLDRGNIALLDGEEKMAEAYYIKSLEAVESYRASIVDDTSKIGFVNDKLAGYGDMVNLLIKQGRYKEAFAYAERSKARALVDILAARKQVNVSNNIGGELVAEMDTAELKLNDFKPLEVQNSTRGVLVSKQEQLKKDNPELASLVTVTPPDPDKLQALIPEGETLIEYYGAGDRLYAFAVTSDDIKVVEISFKGLNADVMAFRKSLISPDSKDYVQCGQVLYKRLVLPLEKDISGKKVTVVPHGALHYLPFNALNSGKGFLIDKYNLRLMPSASVMEYLADHSSQPESLLAFGNPDVNDPSLDLPGAQKEVVSISKKVPNSKVFTREQASKDILISNGRRFKFIHFATHGIFDPEKPLESGLLLSGSNPDQGMLTVAELYYIKLNADLVTLSACETGLGQVASGDDVVGLNRGFLYAGTSSIISSLWKVSDSATAKLMENMYSNLNANMDKRDALRKAQLDLKKKNLAHPYYWAAFQLTGAQ